MPACAMRKFHQYERHVLARHWNPSNATHFNSYFNEDNSLSSSRYQLKCVYLLQCQWIAETCRSCRWIFVSVVIVLTAGLMSREVEIIRGAIGPKGKLYITIRRTTIREVFTSRHHEVPRPSRNLSNITAILYRGV